MTAANPQAERALFEAHARSRHPELNLARQPSPEDYEDPMAKALWDAWMASASRAAPPRFGRLPSGMDLVDPAALPSEAEIAAPKLNLPKIRAHVEAQRAQEALELANHALIPKTASPALLMSMAMRVDHAIAMPCSPNFGPSPQERRDNALRILADMRRVHEEVVGEGFHHPDREQMYLDALASLDISQDDI